MQINMLAAKIHRATVTAADLNYVGSITIDAKLMSAAHIREYQQVEVVNINNGSRLTTYVMSGGDGVICLNGAAARWAHPGDLVIIMAYAAVTEAEAADWQPYIVHVDEHNRQIKD